MIDISRASIKKRREKKIMKKQELNLNKIEDFNTYVNQSQKGMINDIINHFKKKQFRKGDKDDFDERQLFHKSEVDLFFDLYKGTNVAVRELKDKLGNIWCYELYRIK